MSIGGFVPKPHTPFQWAAQDDHETTDARLRKLRDAIRSDRQYGKAIGFRYHDGKPGTIEGLLSRGRPPGRRGDRAGVARRRPVRRLERALLVRPLGARRRESALAGTGVDLDWYTTRERGQHEVLPWDHLDSGLDKDWLWEDWQDALDEVEVDDCRWTPCFDCGVCPAAGHRDPGRPDRPAAAAADRRLTLPVPDSGSEAVRPAERLHTSVRPCTLHKECKARAGGCKVCGRGRRPSA